MHGPFQLLTVENEAAMNMGVQILSISCFQFFWVNIKSGIAGPYELTLLRIAIPLLTVAALTSPLVVYEVSGFFSSLPTLVIYSLLFFYFFIF